MRGHTPPPHRPCSGKPPSALNQSAQAHTAQPETANEPGPRYRLVGPFLTRSDCLWWQRRAEALAHAKGMPERMLEVAIAAIQYTAEGEHPERALRLADDVVLR